MLGFGQLEPRVSPLARLLTICLGVKKDASESTTRQSWNENSGQGAFRTGHADRSTTVSGAIRLTGRAADIDQQG